MNTPQIWTHWRHYKSTGWDNHTYEILWIVRHSETGEDMVLYKPLYDIPKDSWAHWYDAIVRPLSMWEEEVEYKWKQMQRFTQI